MCEGVCKVQVYDVDVSEVVATPDPTNPGDCPKAAAVQDIADGLQPYHVTVGCGEADCLCIPTQEGTYGWTEWLAYDVPAGKELVVVRKDFTTCKYTLTGTYYVSSGVIEGVCMKKPKDDYEYPRKKSSRVRPKKAEKKSGDEKKGGDTPKKKAGKKAGFKSSHLRRPVRLRPRGGRRGSPLG